MTDKLAFQLGNAKLSKAIATFSLPAGWSCPYAKECLSRANRVTGRIVDGKHCRFRCFSVSQESAYPSVRTSRWRNFDMLHAVRSIESMATLIQRSLPRGLTMVRTHVSGDFYSESYFMAWLNVALNNPLTVFYGYTKATPFLVQYRKHIPPNFRFTASLGGTCDNLIVKHRLNYAQVVFSPEEAARKGLEIDHDDSLAFGGTSNFALLLHGTQPPGSVASAAWRHLLGRGIGGYGSRRNISMERPLNIHITLRNGKLHFPPVPQPKFDGWRSLFPKNKSYAKH